jgi:hypothetical protein
VLFGVSGVRNVDALFFMLGWDLHGYDKNHAGTRYAELVFLYPMGSAGHVVHPGYPGRETSMHYFPCSGGNSTDMTKLAPVQVSPKLCFCIRWDQWVT